MRTRVLIVEDSVATRMVVSRLLAGDPEIDVVGGAGDARAAREKMIKLTPDVLLVDGALPDPRGLDSLDKLARELLIEVVELDMAKVDETMTSSQLTEVLMNAGLRARVRAAGRARHRRSSLQTIPERYIENFKSHTMRAARPLQRWHRQRQPIIVVGASTGGVEALQEFLLGMPEQAPGIVIVQHMPEGFTRSFAARCDGLCAISVKEAEQGDQVVQGRALLAPGSYHMRLRHGPSGYHVTLDQEPQVNGHRPSVDVLFESAAQAAGENAVGVIMTGMGKDGARGLLMMKQAGAATIAQDQQTCVVFGMPSEAISLGAADLVLPLSEISAKVLEISGS